MHTYFIFQAGYVEDTCLGVLPASHDEGFVTIEEAVEHFRLTLVALLTKSLAPRSCCAVALKDEDNRFCSTCGKRLDQFRGVSPADVQDAYFKLGALTVDGNSGLLEHFEQAGWHLDGWVEPTTPMCRVQGVGRWMGREDEEDRPYMEGTYPDGTTWSSRR